MPTWRLLGESQTVLRSHSDEKWPMLFSCIQECCSVDASIIAVSVVRRQPIFGTASRRDECRICSSDWLLHSGIAYTYSVHRRKCIFCIPVHLTHAVVKPLDWLFRSLASNLLQVILPSSGCAEQLLFPKNHWAMYTTITCLYTSYLIISKNMIRWKERV